MKILFVCRHNRFRSKIAEAYFKKLNKNKKIKASSAGIFKGIPVDKNVIDIGKKLGIQISRQTKGLKEELLETTDIIVIVANDVPASLFQRARKVIVWKIPDANQNNKKAIEKIAKQIMKKVDILVNVLERRK